MTQPLPSPLKISVIIPCYYQTGDRLRIFETLKAQSRPADEILLVDDCSPADLASAVRPLLPNARVIRNAINRGPAVSRNNGIREASGDLLLFTDLDCFLPTDWIKKAEAIFVQNPHIEAIVGSAKIPDPETRLGHAVSLLGYPGGANLGFEKMWKVSADQTTDHMSSCNFGIRRKTLLQKELFFDETFPLAACEDVELAHRMVYKAGVKLYFCKDWNIHHGPVPSLKAFTSWHFKRGRGAHYLDTGRSKTPKNQMILGRLRSFAHSYRAAKGVRVKAEVSALYSLFLAAQGSGYAFEKLNKLKGAKSSS